MLTIPLTEYLKLPKVSGIYLLTNVVNNKKYIGKSGNIQKRVVAHMTIKDDSRYLYRAFAKYGLEAFTVSVVVEAPEIELNDYETLAIEEYGCLTPNGYNMTLGGDGAPGFRFTPEAAKARAAKRIGSTHTEATKLRMSAAAVALNRKGIPLSEEHRAKIVAASTANNKKRIGTNHSEETRKRISESLKGKPGHKVTEESKAKISASNLGRLRPDMAIKVGELNPMYGKVSAQRRVLYVKSQDSSWVEYSSFSAAASALGVSNSTIADWVSGRTLPAPSRNIKFSTSKPLAFSQESQGPLVAQ